MAGWYEERKSGFYISDAKGAELMIGLSRPSILARLPADWDGGKVVASRFRRGIRGRLGPGGGSISATLEVAWGEW